MKPGNLVLSAVMPFDYLGLRTGPQQVAGALWIRLHRALQRGEIRLIGWEDVIRQLNENNLRDPQASRLRRLWQPAGTQDA